MYKFVIIQTGVHELQKTIHLTERLLKTRHPFYVECSYPLNVYRQFCIFRKKYRKKPYFITLKHSKYFGKHPFFRHNSRIEDFQIKAMKSLKYNTAKRFMVLDIKTEWTFVVNIYVVMNQKYAKLYQHFLKHILGEMPIRYKLR